MGVRQDPQLGRPPDTPGSTGSHPLQGLAKGPPIYTPLPTGHWVSNEGEGAPPCMLCSALMSPGECSGMLQKPQQHTGPLVHTTGTQNRLWGARTPITPSHSPPNPCGAPQVGVPEILKKDVLPTPGEDPQDSGLPLTLNPHLPKRCRLCNHIPLLQGLPHAPTGAILRLVA